jgi:hypothetical protein
MSVLRVALILGRGHDNRVQIYDDCFALQQQNRKWQKITV